MNTTNNNQKIQRFLPQEKPIVNNDPDVNHKRRQNRDITLLKPHQEAETKHKYPKMLRHEHQLNQPQREFLRVFYEHIFMERHVIFHLFNLAVLIKILQIDLRPGFKVFLGDFIFA